MFTLSTRTKNAIKPALAVVIAYGISLGMGWENPYWAGFAVAMISLSTAGQSLNKGAMRMLGTLVAAIAALTLIAWFAQDRWWFIGVLSVYIGFCTYMIAGKKRQYFWYCCAFVCLVICDHAAGNLTNAFNVAVLRVQQTGMGILVYTLVSLFLWPTSSRGMLDDATRKLFTTQATVYRTYRDLLRGHGTAEDSRPLRMQEVQLLGQFGQALNAAVTDSYEVWEVRRQWRRFQRLSTALMEALEQWRESFSEIQSLNLTKLLPNLEDVLSELDHRFAEIERMLTDKPPTRTTKPISLLVEKKEAHTHTHFQKAAVAVTKTQLNRLEMLSRALFDCVGDIKEFDRQSPISFLHDIRTAGFGLDPDRLQAAVKAMATLWTAFLIWFYIDPPGHETLVEFATILAMGSAMMHLSPTTMFAPFMILALLSGVLYIFVMPHLSGYTQLGTMLFGAIFAIYYLFWQPRQGLAKSVGAAMLLSVIGVQNQQTYSFAGFANTIVMVALAIGIAIAIWYVPPSPRPEKAFLRLLTRFCRHSEYLLSRLAPDRDEHRGLATRWEMVRYGNDLLEIPGKLAVLEQRLDYRLLSGQTPEQVQTMIAGLGAIAYRIKELARAGKLPQADRLVTAVIEDLREWRLTAQNQLRLWGEDPALAASQADAMRDRLLARISRLEEKMGETLRDIQEGQLSERDLENFYRILGAFRGLSESGIAFSTAAEGIDWKQLREARF
jgi:uncharacterized membrane protein YccC